MKKKDQKKTTFERKKDQTAECIPWFPPPPSCWGDLAIFEPIILGGVNLILPGFGGLRIFRGHTIILGGLPIFLLKYFVHYDF